MRRLIIISCVLLCPVVKIFSQETYTKLSENPSEAIKGHIGIELYGVDVGFKNISGAMLFAVGATSRYTVSDKIVAEGLFRFPLLRLEKQGGAFMFDAGVAYKLKSNDGPENVKVILGYKEEDNINSNTRTATTKFVDINGTVRRSVYARGGVYLRNSSFDKKSDGDGTVDYKVTNIFHKGIYLGIGREKQYYFQMQRNRSNNPARFGAGSITMWYADVLILPVSVDVEQDTFGMGAGAREELTGLIGGRIGFKWYRNPFTRAQNDNRRIPFFGNSFFTMEAGLRPLEGIYVTGGFTYILHKFK